MYSAWFAVNPSTMDVPTKPATQPEIRDKWIEKFLAHLATDRGASVYTQRNYRQTLTEFARWHLDERKSPAVWENFNAMTSAATCDFLAGTN